MGRDHTMTDVEREKELLRQYNELRFKAPNPRDFPNWEAFYAAQAEHEQKMAELGALLDDAGGLS